MLEILIQLVRPLQIFKICNICNIKYVCNMYVYAKFVCVQSNMLVGRKCQLVFDYSSRRLQATSEA